MQRKDIFFIISFAIISFIIFYPQYISDKIIGWLDMMFYFIPFKEIIVENLREKILPLWNPYIYCGQPLLANFQSAVFYPMNIFYYVFPIDVAFKINTFFIYFIMSTFFYMFLRTINFSEEASFVSSFLFSFSAYMTIRAAEWADLHTIAWMPVTIYFLKKSFINNRLIDSFLTLISLTMSFLAGHPQVFSYMFFLFTAFYFFWSGFTKIKKYFLYVFCLLIISAIQIIPTFEFIKLSSRVSEYKTFYDPHSDMYMKFEHLLQIFFPFIKKFFSDYSKFLNWMALIDIGLPALLLCVFGIIKLTDIKFKDFLLILFTISFILSFLNSIPNYQEIYNKLFFLHLIRYPAKINVIMFFVLCIFTGIGFDILFNNKNNKKFLFIIILLNIIFIFIFLIFYYFKVQILSLYFKYFNLTSDFDYILNNVYSYDMLLNDAMIFLIILFLFMVFLYFIIYKGINNYYIKLIFTLFILFCIFIFNKVDYDSFVTYNDFKGPTKVSNFLINNCSVKTKRILAPTFDKPKSNIMKKAYITTEEKYEFVRSTLQPNIPLFYRFYNLDGFDSLIISGFYDFRIKINKFTNPFNKDIFALTSTKYILSQCQLRGPKLKKIFFDDLHNIYIYERIDSPDIVYFVELKYAVFVDNREQEFEELYNLNYDYNKKIVISKKQEEKYKNYNYNKKQVTKTSIYFERKNINSLFIKIKNSIPGFVVIAENFYPGWIATVNGIKSDIIKVNGFLKGIFVEPGINNIELEYKPNILYIGCIISFLFFIFLLLFIIIYRKKYGKV